MKIAAKELKRNFLFKDIHPHLFIGTMSDRYAGWLGKIYSKEKYEGRITRRTTTVGNAPLVASEIVEHLDL